MTGKQKTATKQRNGKLAAGAKSAVVAQQQRKRYTLDELIAQCDPKAPRKRDDEWLSGPPVGRELI